jgi:hypothetical protein
LKFLFLFLAVRTEREGKGEREFLFKNLLLLTETHREKRELSFFAARARETMGERDFLPLK